MRNFFHSIQLRLDVFNFASHRADYFAYLYMVLAATEGRLTIRELFDRDVQRYGLSNTRGRLSARWSELCEVSGGDLYTTWLSSFPVDELLLIRVAQNHGNQRLLTAFKALADHLDLLIQAKKILWSTVAVAVLALLIPGMLLFVLPWWTVPALKQSFSGLPDAYLGSWAGSLFTIADFLQQWIFLLPLLIVVPIAALVFSLPRANGPIRKQLDKFGIWRLYRQVQALRFLSLIAIILQPGTGYSSQLRPVVSLFYEGSKPWLQQHIQEIIYHIDQGTTDACAFATGLLDRDLFWFFADVSQANGLQSGLQAVHSRMRSHWLGNIQRQATVLRWFGLLVGVAMAVGIGLWHYAAIDDLRRAWMMFHSV